MHPPSAAGGPAHARPDDAEALRADTVAGSTRQARPLAGRTVLLPRLRVHDALGEALERVGATVVRAALTRTVSGREQASQLASVCRSLVAGDAAWLVLTSTRTVEALAPHLRHAWLTVPEDGAPPRDTAGREAVPGSRASRGKPRPGRDAPGPGTGPPGDAPGPGGEAGGVAPPEAGAVSLSGAVRVAVVGPATAHAWEELVGREPDVVASGSAASLLEEPALAAGPHGLPRAGGPQVPAGSAAPQRSGQRAGLQPPLPTASQGSGADVLEAGSRVPAQTAGAQEPSHVAASWRPAAGDGCGRRSASRRVLLPASALADPALARGLRGAGWDVEQVTAYTTVGVSPEELPAGLPALWRGGNVDAVVLTAPSTTRALLGLLGPPSSPTRVVAIGRTTARAAGEAGLDVGAVAASPTPSGVRQAVEDALGVAGYAHGGEQGSPVRESLAGPGPGAGRRTGP